MFVVELVLSRQFKIQITQYVHNNLTAKLKGTNRAQVVGSTLKLTVEFLI